jgi:hypothetical protein
MINVYQLRIWLIGTHLGLEEFYLTLKYQLSNQVFGSSLLYPPIGEFLKTLSLIIVILPWNLIEEIAIV